jgi:hypothetical protein
MYYIVRNLTHRYLYARTHIATSTRLKSLAAGLWFWWRTAWADEDQRYAKARFYGRGVFDGVLKRLGKRVSPTSADRSWSTLSDSPT